MVLSPVRCDSIFIPSKLDCQGRENKISVAFPTPVS
jgi:hypothetical protein